MVTPMRDVDDRDRLVDDEPELNEDDADLNEFFFDEDEPGPEDRRRDPLRKP